MHCAIPQVRENRASGDIVIEAFATTRGRSRRPGQGSVSEPRRRNAADAGYGAALRLLERRNVDALDDSVRWWNDRQHHQHSAAVR